ncbi:MAG: hypothetical protein IT303_07265 [Dehalococcoidia bacterium]|nr:hypothetical protein [Dehalococcoidia bacterium]
MTGGRGGFSPRGVAEVPEPEEWTGLTSAAISVLTQLKRAPGQDVDQLAAALWRSVSAVRPVLKRLHMRGYVEYLAVGQGPGRRRHVYSLTARGDSIFPNNVRAYAQELTAFVKQEDPALYARFIDQMEVRRGEAAIARAGHSSDPALREQAMVAQLAESGFLPEVHTEDGQHELVLHHCPYLPVAEVCASMCKRDHHCLESLLGVHVESAETRIDGASACRFRYSLPGAAAAG